MEEKTSQPKIKDLEGIKDFLSSDENKLENLKEENLKEKILYFKESLKLIQNEAETELDSTMQEIHALKKQEKKNKIAETKEKKKLQKNRIREIGYITKIIEAYEKIHENKKKILENKKSNNNNINSSIIENKKEQLGLNGIEGKDIDALSEIIEKELKLEILKAKVEIQQWKSYIQQSKLPPTHEKYIKISNTQPNLMAQYDSDLHKKNLAIAKFMIEQIIKNNHNEKVDLTHFKNDEILIEALSSFNDQDRKTFLNFYKSKYNKNSDNYKTVKNNIDNQPANYYRTALKNKELKDEELQNAFDDLVKNFTDFNKKNGDAQNSAKLKEYIEKNNNLSSKYNDLQYKKHHLINYIPGWSKRTHLSSVGVISAGGFLFAAGLLFPPLLAVGVFGAAVACTVIGAYLLSTPVIACINWVKRSLNKKLNQKRKKILYEIQSNNDKIKEEYPFEKFEINLKNKITENIKKEKNQGEEINTFSKCKPLNNSLNLSRISEK